MRRIAVAVMAAVVSVTALAACGGDDERPVVAQEPESAPSAWERLPDPPIPPRARAVTVWTGEEVLVVGGDQFSCPAAASCTASTDPPLVDGAAFDLDAGTWRAVADAPVPFHSGRAAVVGGDVYLLVSTDYSSGTAFLRYRPATDEWSQPTPPSTDGAWYQLVDAGDRLVAYPGSEETGVVGDVVYDPEADTWSPLPADPMTAAFNRAYVWHDPHLYLFDQENVPQPSSETPSLVRAARLDLASSTWERLPDSEQLGSGGPWFVEGGRLINPYLGSADGGEVNGWGRSYPYGGAFDVASMTWTTLPAGPDDVLWGAGGFGATSAAYLGTSGPVLDATNGTWLTMPQLVDPTVDSPMVIAAGRDAIAYVGGGLWIWRAP